jgi:hypothetical protein
LINEEDPASCRDFFAATGNAVSGRCRGIAEAMPRRRIHAPAHPI